MIERAANIILVTIKKVSILRNNDNCAETGPAPAAAARPGLGPGAALLAGGRGHGGGRRALPRHRQR